MSLQRQHFLISYLKTPSVGPAGIRTHDLPHGSPVLNQLSQPVGEKVGQLFQVAIHFHPSQTQLSLIITGSFCAQVGLLLIIQTIPLNQIRFFWLFIVTLKVGDKKV